MVELLSQSLVALALYGLFVLVYTILGAYHNINIWKMSFDWKIWANGLAKWLLLGFSVIATVLGVAVLFSYADRWGVDIPQAQAVSSKAIFAVMVTGCLTMVAKITQKLAGIFGVSKEVLESIQKTALEAEADEVVALEIEDLPKLPKDYVKQKLEAEKIGGLGAVYSVPINSYEAFRSAVINRGYDIDGAYSYQCWDGAALLWQQLGQSLITGNGAARGCWELNRDRNANPHFDLIFDKTQIKRGDVLFFGGSRWGHVGFADENFANRGYISVLGQNQRGNGNGYVFTVDNISMVNFLGAMRLKKWRAATTPAPAPQPQNTGSTAGFNLGDTVEFVKAVDTKGTPLAVSGTYNVVEISNGSIVVARNGAIIARVYPINLRKVEVAKPVENSSTQPLKVGDRVVPTRLVSYDGVPLTQWDDSYELAELVGDRAVLVARGQVWAAMNIKDLRKA